MSASRTGDGASALRSQPSARRKFWGWGLEGQGLAADEIEQLGAVFTERLGIDGLRVQEPPEVEELDLPAPRLVPPASFRRPSAPIRTTGPPTRTAGRSAIWCVPSAGITRMRLILWRSLAARAS